MKDEKWSEQEIEELLSQAPKVHDNRSKEDVFARLQEAGAFEEEKTQVQQVVKRKYNRIYTYGLAVAMTLLTFSGIYYVMSNSSEYDTASTFMDTANEETLEMENESLNVTEEAEATSAMIRNFSMTDIRTAVYPEQLENSKVFSIGLAGDDAESVPVTIVIPHDKLVEDFGTNAPTQVEMYNKYAQFLDEQAAGFSEYHPVKGTITEQGDTVIHTLPENHGYDTASATMAMYIGMLVDTFSKSYEKVVMLNEEGSAITFSEVGEPSEPLLLKEQKRYSYFIDEQESGMYLSPNFRQSFNSVTEALNYMKIEENDVYQTAILPDVDYNVSDGDIVTIRFTEPLDLQLVDPQQAMYMIEAMLLTAAGFDKQVRFENIVQTEWQGFNFTQPLPMPIGANKLPLDLLYSLN